MEDAKVRTEAESQLGEFREHNLPSFLLSFPVELSNDGKPTESRRLAGIISLDAKEATRKGWHLPRHSLSLFLLSIL